MGLGGLEVLLVHAVVDEAFVDQELHGFAKEIDLVYSTPIIVLVVRYSRDLVALVGRKLPQDAPPGGTNIGIVAFNNIENQLLEVAKLRGG